MSEQPAAAPPTLPPRFGWPMRIFLFWILFHMIVRSTGILYPWEDWLDELRMPRMPRPLPTRAALAKLRAEADGSCEPGLKEFKECGKSLLRFWNPAERSEETQKELTSATAWAKYTAAWTLSRMQWCECVVSIDQEWAMFSPNVRRRGYVARARLRYEDGSETTILSRSEPHDYTCYARYGEGKTLGIDRFVFSDHGARFEACPGYCNFLTHLYPKNERGSPLEAILLYELTIDFVPPGTDAHAFLKDLQERTRDHRSKEVSRTFYVYLPKERSGQFIRYENDKPVSYPEKLLKVL